MKKIMNQKLFPTIIIILFICASGVCFYHGDWRKGICWFAAAVLNAAITF